MLGLRITLICAVLVGCERSEVSTEWEPPSKVETIPEYQPLVGTWSGNVHTDSFGSLHGVIAIDGRGAGSFFASAAGFHRSGPLQILSFEDGVVRVRAMGVEKSASIRVEASRLWIQNTPVGTVLLRRSSR